MFSLFKIHQVQTPVPGNSCSDLHIVCRHWHIVDNDRAHAFRIRLHIPHKYLCTVLPRNLRAWNLSPEVLEPFGKHPHNQDPVLCNLSLPVHYPHPGMRPHNYYMQLYNSLMIQPVRCKRPCWGGLNLLFVLLLLKISMLCYKRTLMFQIEWIVTYL